MLEQSKISRRAGQVHCGVSTEGKGEGIPEATIPASDELVGLGNFHFLGENVSTAGLVFILLLGLGTAMVTLTIYHYRHAIRVRSGGW
jgi:hypothetical protein